MMDSFELSRICLGFTYRLINFPFDIIQGPPLTMDLVSRPSESRSLEKDLVFSINFSDRRGNFSHRRGYRKNFYKLW